MHERPQLVHPFLFEGVLEGTQLSHAAAIPLLRVAHDAAGLVQEGSQPQRDLRSTSEADMKGANVQRGTVDNSPLAGPGRRGLLRMPPPSASPSTSGDFSP